MADYIALLKGSPADYLPATAACFLEAQGVDPNKLQNPERHRQEGTGRSGIYFDGKDKTGASVQVRLFTESDRYMWVEIAPPPSPDTQEDMPSFSNIRTETSRSGNRAVRSDIRGLKNGDKTSTNATTDMATGETDYVTRNTETGVHTPVAEKDAPKTLRETHLRARDCMNQF